MNRYGVLLICFCCFLGMVIVAADTGAGPRYWGWLKSVPLGDKLCHAAFMFTFCLLANLALSRRRLRAGSPILLGSLIVTALVVLEEFSQRWIPGRSFDLFDLAADFLGLATADFLSRETPSRLCVADLGRENAS
ncbi:MAG: VanZ family protein [Isosphaeraceae bacterium]